MVLLDRALIAMSVMLISTGTIVAMGIGSALQPRRPGQEAPKPSGPATPQQPATPTPAAPSAPVPAPVAPVPGVPTSVPGQPAPMQPVPGAPANPGGGGGVQPSVVPAPPIPVPTGPSFLDKVITARQSQDWTLKVHVHLAAYQTDPNKLGKPGYKELQVIPLKFDTAAVVFPVPYSSASHTTNSDGIRGTLLFDDRPVDKEFDFADNYAGGTRLARWEMLNKQGRQVDLNIEIPMTCFETIFDEKLAEKAIWPVGGVWPGEAASTFGPQLGVDYESPVIAAKLSEWTKGKDAKTLKPVVLAKFLALRVLEAIQPSGLGLVSDRNGQLEGFALQGASRTLELGRGSEHDIACLLCAVYRAAGLPARTVIGYDVKATPGQEDTVFRRNDDDNEDLRSWVEFYLFDAAANKGIWVPVDVARARQSSSRATALDKPMRYFGTNDELDDVLPVAFQYHPPTTVVAHGSPAFWGWLTTPRLQQGASQFIRFQAMNTPKRGKPKQRDTGR